MLSFAKVNKMMKYFTMEWLLACQDSDVSEKDMNRPAKDYGRYYTSIKKQLPIQFVVFDKSYSLHDAMLRKLNFNVEKQQLKINLMLAIVHKKFIEGRKGTITYTGVTDFSSSKRIEKPLAGSDSHGFLVYDEIEVISPGVFEHRLLFESGIELNITFTYSA